MAIIYVTLNTVEEARTIGKKILEAKLSNCVNWFPITCMYRWEGKITDEPEVVMLVKTKKEFFKKIETIIKSEIDYTNCIAEISVGSQRKEFIEWLEKETAA